MVTRIASSTTVATGLRVNLLTGENAYIMAGVLLASIDDTAISSASGSGKHTVTVMGEVFGELGGIYLTGTSGEHVIVRAGGSVSSALAICLISKDSVLVNYGTITGTNQAVQLIGDSARLINHGSMIGAGNLGAVYLSQGITAGTYSLSDNFGTITGLDVGGLNLAFAGADNYKDVLRNFGTIDGSVSLKGGDDVMLNRGVIVGSIDTGAGNDRLDNTGGRVEGDIRLGADNDLYIGKTGTVTGTVLGEAGNDTMIGNPLMDETFDGGLGTDTLDFRSGPAVILALDDSFESGGAAEGDTYTGFELVNGSNIGADQVTGNASLNVLTGFGGNDSLDGAGGNDFLRGGRGVDVLTGGAGNDSFRFYALAECGDTITDFSNAPGNDDQFQINAAAFGGGLVAGVLSATQFQTRADNLAQDGDDRFIFRTTDQTLWFDIDGTGSVAARLVADLQAGAVVTALDFLLL